MRRTICVLMVLLPLLVLPALGAELSFPQVDELLQEAEGYGVAETDGLGQGVQSILETGLDQAGSLLRHSLQTGLKLLAVVLLCGLAESAALDGKAGGLKAVEVAPRDEVETGDAVILSNIRGDAVEEFDVRITHVDTQGDGTRSLMLEVTDPELLQATGGIVQGMSGSPILQNGRLVGAVTHVLVDDPTRGYGIFAETMLKAAGGQ